MTQLQDASAAQAPKTATAQGHNPQAQDLICDPSEIFDLGKVHTALEDAITPDMAAKDIRAATVACLLEVRKTGFERIGAAIAETPLDSEKAVHSYTYLCDCVVRTVYEVAKHHIHPPLTRKESEQLSLIAVGGYGRG
ncbi:MAG: hypothetical protein OIF40_00605, partial [Mangrovicoccus sp.]|nr:hypothetical protein [Mangrovicoccus sp.]